MALLRLPVDGVDWCDHLPPAPAGHDVSVSCEDDAVWQRLRPRMRQLGYRVVDDPAARGGAGEAVVDVLVRDGCAEDRPTWWRAVAALADRAYPLQLGPAARSWEDLVERHSRGAASARGNPRRGS